MASTLFFFAGIKSQEKQTKEESKEETEKLDAKLEYIWIA